MSNKENWRNVEPLGYHGLEELDRIAIDISGSKHGDFLKTVALAWQLADAENKGLMLPLWVVLIEKYKLNEAMK